MKLIFKPLNKPILQKRGNSRMRWIIMSNIIPAMMSITLMQRKYGMIPTY